MKNVWIFICILAVMFFGIGCTQKESQKMRGKVKIGAKNFTEQFILGRVMSLYLQKNGFEVKEHFNMGSAVVRKALENGQIDMYIEYTGTAYLVYHKGKDHKIMRDPQRLYTAVKKRDAKEGLVWLSPAKFNNTYTIMMKEDEARKLKLKTISDLVAYIKERPRRILFAMSAEFYGRPDGLNSLQRVYGFTFPSEALKKMDSGLTYKALKEGKVNVAMGFATDGRVKGFGLINLIDDKGCFPVYNPAPVIREETLERYPEIPELLNKLMPLLDTPTIMQLNYQVDVLHESAGEVCKCWLQKVGLI